MSKKKVCVITGTRAEYGLLQPLMRRIKESKKLNLQIIATGMHLSPEFGLTYNNIEEDGFIIDEKIEILLSSDTSIGISKSMGLTMISFSEAYERLQPDLIVILGDRFETFSAMTAATVAKIPVAHIHGGELTEGAFDDSFRHSMTKMAYMHFTSTEEYNKRVIQLGEEPNRVFNVGALGVENTLNINLFSKEELESKLKIQLGDKYVLVVFHPVTLESGTAKKHYEEILNALTMYDKALRKVFIKCNSDTEGRIINQTIDEFVKKDENSYSFTSLPVREYLSLLKYSWALIGNSSSGILEAPSLKVPSINIGDRQKGRIRAESVVDCSPQRNNIIKALKYVESENYRVKLKKVTNPYGDGNTSKKILAIIEEFLLKNKINLKKKFYDIKVDLE